MRIKKNLTWTLGYSHSPDIVPKDFIPARVPGAVQLDMRRECGLPDYNYEIGRASCRERVLRLV